VLHWRLGVLGATPAPRPREPLASLPPAAGPAADVARQAGELMQARWRDLRATLAATTAPLPWAPTLGTRPPDPAAQSAWLTAATAVTAYRERYDVPAHTPMIGPRPAISRPDARAAWDHACLQTDRYLTRRLRHLTCAARKSRAASRSATRASSPSPPRLAARRRRRPRHPAPDHSRTRPPTAGTQPTSSHPLRPLRSCRARDRRLMYPGIPEG
jgi:hypothetical protein